MFKKILLFVLIALFITTLTGCSEKEADNHLIKEFIFGEETVLNKFEDAEKIKLWIEEKAAVKGTYKKNFGDYDVYLVALGEKPTGGYKMDLGEHNLVNNEKWVIEIIVEKPGPRDIVTQALTYPYIVFAVAKDIDVEINLNEYIANRGINFLDEVEIEGEAEYVKLDFIDKGNIFEDILLVEGVAEVEKIRIILEDGHYMYYDKEFAFDLINGKSSFSIEVEMPDKIWAGFLMMIIMAEVDSEWVEDIYVPIELPK